MLKQLIIAGLIAYAVQWTIGLMDFVGFFQRLYNVNPGVCHRLKGTENGSEDMQALPNGLAFISSGVRVRHSEAYNHRPGRIFLFDFNQPDAPPQELPIKAGKDFQLVSPHGINIWTNPTTGDAYLYVVSHFPKEIVDKFKFEPATRSLLHLRRFQDDPNFQQLNDILVVGDDQFYFTNWYYYNDMIEYFFGIRWGSLGFYDSTKSTLIETNLYMPNGLAISPDRRYLYVAQPGEKDILVYSRHEGNSLTLKTKIKVWTIVDNLDVDTKTGDIWFGAHPIGYKIAAYLDDPTYLAPSQVMRVQMSDGNAVKVEEIYCNDGTEIPASTAAVRYGDGLLIGSVASQAIYCEMPKRR